MLALATLHGLLLRILSPPHFHTVVLHTPAGELISAASDPPRPKDEIYIVVGLSGEVWKETKEGGFGMVDSEVGQNHYPHFSHQCCSPSVMRSLGAFLCSL